MKALQFLRRLDLVSRFLQVFGEMRIDEPLTSALGLEVEGFEPLNRSYLRRIVLFETLDGYARILAHSHHRLAREERNYLRLMEGGLWS
jgi:hypothetical protein